MDKHETLKPKSTLFAMKSGDVVQL